MSHIRGFFTRTPADSERRRATAVVTIALVGTLGTLGLLLLAAPSALALPEGRVYEMVSPPYKGGYDAELIHAVSPDGEQVAFFSKGIFAGAPSGPMAPMDYVARRGPSGWTSSPTMVPAGLATYVEDQDVSASMDQTVAFGKPGPNVEAAYHAGTEEEFLLHSLGAPDTAGGWELAGMPLKALDEAPVTGQYKSASADLCHLLVYNMGVVLLPEAAEAEEPNGQVYEVDRGCHGGASSLRLVALNNAHRLIAPACQMSIGIEQTQEGKSSAFNAVSASGEEVFFTTSPGKAGSCVDQQLFLRLGGERTIEVSKPVSESEGCGESVPCPGAASRPSSAFVGASRDGSKVFFTTKASLAPGEDSDGESDLYMAVIGCPAGEAQCEAAQREVSSLVQVSHDPSPGEPAEVQGVVRVAPDGSRVYFIARGVLAGANVEGQAPVRYADNLYVHDSSSGKTSFIADLCSGPRRTGPEDPVHGPVEDLRCPSGLEGGLDHRNDTSLWLDGGSLGEAQTAGPAGGVLVFSSYGRLTGDDTDDAKDVFRYDAEKGVLERVSLGEEGFDANGNGEMIDARITPGHWGGSVKFQYEMDNRAVTEDGSRIVFLTSERLSGAANGLQNVYEWHQGAVSLISSGSSEGPAEDVVISPTGGDVFFVLAQGLVSQDTDGERDIYDARLQGGFPEPPAPPRACSGDACQGPLTDPAPLLVPGSVSQAPGGNFSAAPVRAVKAKKKPRHRGKRKPRPKRAGHKASASKVGNAIVAGRGRR